MKRIMITGSEGTIGPYVVKALREHYSDLELTRVVSPWRMTADRDRVEKIDLRVEGPAQRHYDAVIHLAASHYTPTHDLPAWSKARLGLHVVHDDLAMIGNLLDSGMMGLDTDRVVFASSALVYGRKQGTEPLHETETEEAPLPADLYGAGKLLGERMMKTWAEGMVDRSYTNWRIFNTISPLEPHNRPGHLHVDLFRKMFIEYVNEIVVGTEQRRIIWVEEVAEAIVKYLFDPRAENQTINLAGDQSVSPLLIAMELRALGRLHGYQIPTAITQALYSGESRPLPSIQRAARLLDWAPQIGPGQALDKFVAAKAGKLALP